MDQGPGTGSGTAPQVQRPAIRPAVPVAAQRVAWRRSALAATAVDEVLLAILSLGLALILIRGASKAEYGVFALVSTVLLLLRAVQNSLVLTPLATIGGRLRGRERCSFVRALSLVQAAIGVGLALAVAAVLWILLGGEDWPLVLGSGLALVGTWLREYRRGLAIADGRPGGALAGDGLYALLALSLTVGPWLVCGVISAATMLAATGIAGVAALIGFPPSSTTESATGHRQVVRAAIAQARWTLPGAAIGWSQQSGYIYAVGLVLGAAAVGEMVAARLFVAPLLLVTMAWSRMFLPQATALIADGGDAVLLARCGRALRFALVGSAAYLMIPAGAFMVGVGQLFPAEYAGCEMQVLAWGGFAVVHLIRTIASTSLLARMEFRPLFAMTLASAGVSILLIVLLLGPLGAAGAIVGLTSGEALLGGLAWRALLARPAADRAALLEQVQGRA